MSTKDEYVQAICHELELRKNYLDKDTIHTIYWGGGTPSQLDCADIATILNNIYKNYSVAENVEITMEANPDDLTHEYIRQLRLLPINRLSIGIQSFDDNELAFLERRHSAQQAIKAVRECKQAGFENMSIDLMYGLPKQTMQIWENNLQQAIELGIQHISSYHLIYEQSTKLYKLLEKGKVNTLSEDLSLTMFSTMIDTLGNAGFEHYEISNFARNSLYSKHNTSYWLNEKYIGIGTAAHSYNGQERAWNIDSIAQYINAINKAQPAIEIEKSTLQTKYNDFVLTGLRTMWGINLTTLEKLFGAEMLDYCMRNIAKHIALGTVKKVDNKLILSKQGVFVSDDIMSDLMYIG